MSLSSMAVATALAVSAITLTFVPLLPDLGNDGYQVAAYDLTYDVDPSTTLLPGTARITAVADRRLSKFRLDYAADRAAKAPSPVDDTAGWANGPDGSFAWFGQPFAPQLAQVAAGKYALVAGTGPNGLPLRSTTPPMPGHPDWTPKPSTSEGAHSAPALRPGS